MGLDIQSKEVIDKISDELKVQPALAIPRELSDKIQLVYAVNPVRHLIQTNGGTLSDGTSATPFSFHATKNTFVTGLTISVAKSVLSQSINSSINLIIKGSAATSAFLTINYEPLTVGSNLNMVMKFDPPPFLFQKARLSI